MLNVVVTRKQLAATGVHLFELRSQNGGALPEFTAGAHIDVEVAPGLTRQYSLCNPPGVTDAYRIAVLRDANSRGGSAAMAEAIRCGAKLRISAPRNHFPLVAEAKSARLFAGGIGITPILAMARQLWSDGKAFRLLYAARSRSKMAFHRDISRSAFADMTVFHADDEAQHPLDLAGALTSPTPGEHVYVCGPTGFIDAVLTTARAAGWSDDRLHREHFTPAAAVSAEGDQPFTLRLAKTGRDIAVPADRSALDVLADHGIEIESSCEQGVCGTCLTRVLEGTPDHRDLLMSDAEHAANDQFTPCCSRSLSPVLVVDL